MVLAASATPAVAKAPGDAAVIRELLKLELTAASAYETGLRKAILDRRLAAVATLFKRHEMEHARALGAALKALGDLQPARADAKLLAPLGGIHTQAGFVDFAIEFENKAVAAYHDAAGKLGDAALLRTAAQIMADEGQHLVVLRQALGRNPVPNPFETGEKHG